MKQANLKQVNYQYTTSEIYPKTISHNEAKSKVDAGESVVVFIKTDSYSFFAGGTVLVEPKTYEYDDGSGHTEDEWSMWRGVHNALRNKRIAHAFTLIGEDHILGYDYEGAEE